MLSASTPSPGHGAIMTDLLSGNLRYARDAALFPIYPFQDDSRRYDLYANGQKPKAVVLACSDSRVPIELIFDQGIGDIFVIRAAGGTPGPDEIGSLEYAIEHLHCQVMIIMSHKNCGAIKSALDKGSASGFLLELLNRLDPVVNDPVVKAFTGNAKYLKAIEKAPEIISKEILTKSKVLNELHHEGEFDLYQAVYDIDSGIVDVLKHLNEKYSFVKEEEEEKSGWSAVALAGLIVGCIVGGILVGGLVVYLICGRSAKASIHGGEPQP